MSEETMNLKVSRVFDAGSFTGKDGKPIPKKEFFALDDDGNELKITTFKRSLFDEIVEGKELKNAKLTTTENTGQDGTVFTNRKLINYDGAPQTYSGGFKGSSFDPVLSRTQTAVNATALMLSNKVEVPKDIKDSTFDWIRESFKVGSPAQETPSQAEADNAETPERPAEKHKLTMDMDWLNKQLKTLGWGEKETRFGLKDKYGIPLRPELKDMLTHMNDLQQHDFHTFIKAKVAEKEGEVKQEDIPF